MRAAALMLALCGCVVADNGSTVSIAVDAPIAGPRMDVDKPAARDVKSIPQGK